MSFKSVKRPRLTPAALESIKWPNLPPEMRATVIEKMDEKTLCQFSACSKSSRAGAKQTGHFMSGIKIAKDLCGSPHLEIQHGLNCSYRLEFIDVPESPIDQTMVFYKTRLTTATQKFEKDVFFVRWAELVNGTPEEVRGKYLIDHCQKYEDTIRNIVFKEKTPSKINLKNMKKLEKIDLEHCDEHFEGIEINQLLNARTLKANNYSFTFDQFIQFNGEYACIKMNEFNEETLANYLDLLNTSEIQKNLSGCVIYTANSNNRIPTYEFLEELSKKFNIKFKRRDEDTVMVLIRFDFGEMTMFLNKNFVLIFREKSPQLRARQIDYQSIEVKFQIIKKLME